MSGGNGQTAEDQPTLPAPIDIFAALTTDQAALDFVLPGFLRGTVGALIASGGLGKSWLILELCILIGSGLDVLGIGGEWAPHPLKPGEGTLEGESKAETVGIKSGRVLYLPAEDPPEIIKHRLRALSVAMKLTPDQCRALAKNLVILPLIGKGPDLGRAGWRKLLLEQARGCRFVTYDTLRRFHRCDEKDGKEMGAVLAAMEVAALETGAAHLFAHHANKAAVMGGKADEQGASRGASDLTDNARWQANLSGLSTDEAKKRKIPEDRRKHFVKLDIPKNNYGAPSPTVVLERLAGGILRKFQQTGEPSGVEANGKAKEL